MFKKKMQWVILAFVLFVGGFMYVQSDHEWALTQRAMTEVAEGVYEGEQFPSFTLENVDGEEVVVTADHDERMLLFFFTSWCHVCSNQWEQISIANDEGLLENVTIVPVNLTSSEQSEGDVGQYIEQLPVPSANVLLDRDGDVQDKYEVFGVPTVLFLNEEGVIEKRSHGLITLDDFRESDFFH
ncbi:TlpA family protein disulfide reductase [Evansella halocellulosilytica]|uniref:TlpA family protein disulfide reductase n=1 Tax=Evansella halocellulosilytica TaxID=2011013 RepID=UPI0015C72ABE|nr:TlpA disulfide reductase family protein [Evansella halocellulosilytica]